VGSSKEVAITLRTIQGLDVSGVSAAGVAQSERERQAGSGSGWNPSGHFGRSPGLGIFGKVEALEEA